MFGLFDTLIETILGLINTILGTISELLGIDLGEIDASDLL